MRLARLPLSAIGLLALVWMAGSPLLATPPADWKLVFSDEFDGDKLDSAKWTTTMGFPGIHGPRYHNEYYLSYTLDEDVIVSGGLLHLLTERQPVYGTAPEGHFDYSQGLVSTDGKFSFTYGYVEIRAKYPGGAGLWPCFWLMAADQTWPPEFDVAEFYAGQGKMHHGLAHGTARETKWDSSLDEDTDFVKEWHTIGIEWTPGKAVWYVDGKACHTVEAEYVPSSPMYVILSNGISSRFGPSGAPDESTVFPNDFEIDYIHIFQPPPVVVKADKPMAKPQAEARSPIIAVLPAGPLP